MSERLEPRDLADLVALTVHDRLPLVTVTVQRRDDETMTTTLMAGIVVGVQFGISDEAATHAHVGDSLGSAGEHIARSIERSLFEVTKVALRERDVRHQRQIASLLAQSALDGGDTAAIVAKLAQGTLDVEL